MRVAVAAMIGCALLTGCKPDPAVEKATLVNRGVKAPAPPPGGGNMGIDAGGSGPVPAGAPTGSVAGMVLFSGKAPAQPAIDTSMDPACAMSGGSFTAEQYVVNAGKLANVFVYVKSGPVPMNGSGQSLAPAVLDQKGCRYVPHVLGVMQGGFVEFHNSDPTMHNIHTMPTNVGNETVDVSQGPKGAPQSKQFAKPELMIPVRCNNHPWMNAFINVAPTPYFAVSGTDGRFSIAGLPPGDYVLAAVHEKLGEKTMTVHISSNASTKAEFGFAAGK